MNYFAKTANDKILIYYDTMPVLVAEIDCKTHSYWLQPGAENKQLTAFIQGQLNLLKNTCNKQFLEHLNRIQTRSVCKVRPIAAGGIYFDIMYVYGDFKLIPSVLSTYCDPKPVFGKLYTYDEYRRALNDPDSEFYKQAVDIHKITDVLINDYEAVKIDKTAFSHEEIKKLYSQYKNRLSIFVQIEKRK